MRRFLIDTDTASDDAVALIMALREKSIKVEAITVVSGNVPVETGLKNALCSVEAAGTYAPPVYKGIDRPILRAPFTSEFVHGEDGMGNICLPDPGLKPQKKHAVDAIIELIMENPGKIEVVTLGPLTNLAIAYLKEPRIARNIKSMVIMGSEGFGPGNVTAAAEFNFYVDAEAASIVLNSGAHPTIVGWDVSMGKTFIDQDDIAYLTSRHSEIADFCVRCNRVLQQFNLEKYGKAGFDLPDPTAMAVAISPDIIKEKCEAYTYIETKSEYAYGKSIIDIGNISGRECNTIVCKELDAKKFKDMLFRLIV